ncbi:Ig-like domain-containing protein [Candidatus Uhrbacteria bacterium]|nr:Ig-like domain-containing protein [Candidatus Uhrbacteria bacterium]
MVTFAVVAPTVTFAQGTGVAGGLQAVGEAGGIAGGTTDIYTIVGRIINIVLGLLGTVLLVIMLYSGYEWMTSGGDPGKVDSAKTRIRNAVIGLVIIMSSFAIVNFILGALISSTGGGGGAGGRGPGGPGGFGFPGASGSLGGGIVESHVPQRDATEVPRNTAIVITFKEPINISSFIRDYDDNGTPADLSDDATSSTTTGINNDNVKVYVSGARDGALTTAQARVRFTADRQTFVIKPVEYLGSATENTTYTVELTNDIEREDGTDAFSGAFSSGYRWQFEVSTIVDLTPPHITSVIPRDGGRFAPNIVVQINFNEAIDPTSSAGEWNGTAGFTNIRVAATPVAGGATTRPSGEFRISNQYRTVEFVTDLACGTNSCGRTVYCLPTDSSIAVEAFSPSMSDTPPQAILTSIGYDGVVDMAGNGLDGNGDGDAQGSESDSIPGDDRYGWTFGTSDAPNLTPPTLRSTNPTAGDLASSSNIPLDQKPEALFDSLLQGSTVNSETVGIRTNEPAELADTFWWSVSQDFLTAGGTPAGVGEEPVNSNVMIGHRLYTPATSTSAVPVYQPIVLSGVQNVYQNCFNPAGSVDCRADSTNPNCCDGSAQSGACAAPRPLTP